MEFDSSFLVSGLDKNTPNLGTIKSVIYEISDLCPSDALLDIQFKKRFSRVFVRCRISSLSGVYFISASGKNHLDAVNNLQDKVQLKLQNWIHTRLITA